MGHDPTEEAQEHVQHEAAHGHGPKWIMWAALTAAFLAALAAVSSSLATKHLTESTLTRIEANDQWNFYQAKSIKRSIIDGRDMQYSGMQESGKVPPAAEKQHQDDIKKKVEYATPVNEEKDPEKPQGMLGIQELATRLQDESKVHLTTHETYEMSATMFHIAIAVVAISVVAKRKEFWYMSMVGGVVGLYFFGAAIVHAPVEKRAEHKEAATEHAAASEHAASGTGHEAATHEGPAATEHH